MSETTKTNRTRKPWWVLGSDLVTSPIITAFFAFMAWRTVDRLMTETNGWDVAYLVVLVALVLSGLASIVYYVRNPDKRYNPFESRGPR